MSQQNHAAVETASMVETNLPTDAKRTGPLGGDAASKHPVDTSSLPEWSKRAQHRLRERTEVRQTKSGQREEVEGCVKVVFELLEIFGMTKRGTAGKSGRKVDESYRRTLSHWLEASLELGPGGWMKFAKWKFASFFHAGGLAQWDAPPPSPTGLSGPFCHGDQLAAGIAGRYALRLTRGAMRGQFLASVLQLKKGCPRPGKELLNLAVRKTVKALSEEKKAPAPINFAESWGDEDEFETAGLDEKWYTVSQDSLQFHLIRTVQELFGGKSYANNDKYRTFFPSTSATFTDSVREGGAFRSIQKFAGWAGLSRNIDRNPLVRVAAKHAAPVDREEGIRTFAEQQARRHRVTTFHADLTDLEAVFGDLYERTLQRALTGTNRVKAVALSEALKVRVITKGEASRGFVLKPLQKWMWKVLRDHPVFTLIGQPVDKWYLQSRLGARLPEGQAYLSGDYSAATDNLSSLVSETIAAAIAEVGELTNAERLLFVEALTHHDIVDPENSTKSNTALLQQKWGQLMGSVVSFPVLCIANAALCRWALELDAKKKMSLRQTTLMVNGDDCAMRCTRDGLRFWKAITTYAGLEPSVGKFFFSPEFVQINSENFERLDDGEYDVDPESGKARLTHFRSTPYVNFGLLRGLKRSGGEVGVAGAADSSETIGARARDLVAHCPVDLLLPVWEAFLKHNRTALAECHVPWYIPERYGGIGLPLIQVTYPAREPGEQVVSPVTFYGPSELDRRVVARIAEQPDLYDVRKLPTKMFWYGHKIAMERMRSLSPFRNVVRDSDEVTVEVHERRDWISQPTESEQSEFDKLYTALVVERLFDVVGPHAQSDKDMERQDEHRLQVLRRNERVWKRALHAERLPPPVGDVWLARTPESDPILLVETESLYLD